MGSTNNIMVDKLGELRNHSPNMNTLDQLSNHSISPSGDIARGNLIHREPNNNLVLNSYGNFQNLNLIR